MTKKRTITPTFKCGSKLLWIALSAFLGLIVVITLYVLMLRYGGFDEEKWKATGVFGDSFGLLNAIVASFAFIGIVVTLYMQHTQTKEMRRASIMGNVPFVSISHIQMKITQGDLLKAKGIKFILKFNYVNASDTPALDVCTSISIVLRDKKGNRIVGRGGVIPISRFVRSHVARTTDEASLSTPQFETCAIVSREDAYKFIACLVNGTSPKLKVECIYRNFFDICCRVSDVFDINISSSQGIIFALQHLLDGNTGLLKGVDQRNIAENERHLRDLNFILEHSLVYVPSKKLTTKEFFRTASQFDTRIGPFESDWGLTV